MQSINHSTVNSSGRRQSCISLMGYPPCRFPKQVFIWLLIFSFHFAKSFIILRNINHGWSFCNLLTPSQLVKKKWWILQFFLPFLVLCSLHSGEKSTLIQKGIFSLFTLRCPAFPHAVCTSFVVFFKISSSTLFMVPLLKDTHYIYIYSCDIYH